MGDKPYIRLKQRGEPTFEVAILCITKCSKLCTQCIMIYDYALYPPKNKPSSLSVVNRRELILKYVHMCLKYKPLLPLLQHLGSLASFSLSVSLTMDIYTPYYCPSHMVNFHNHIQPEQNRKSLYMNQTKQFRLQITAFMSIEHQVFTFVDGAIFAA